MPAGSGRFRRLGPTGGVSWPKPEDEASNQDWPRRLRVGRKRGEARGSAQDGLGRHGPSALGPEAECPAMAVDSPQ